MDKVHNPCQSCWALAYDVFAQIISVLDVTTDIIVCVEFYLKGRWVFFGLSLSIIILAFLSYSLAFLIRFNSGGSICKMILFFLFILLFSPILPFVFYFTHDEHNWLSQFIKNHICFEVHFESNSVNNQQSSLKQFMEEKMVKHLGFILEALVEALPQAILQMIAIVYYNEALLIPIISIFISLLSVSSKSFIFSISAALNLKQLFLNWLSAVTDFFYIFFVVSWCFYGGIDDHELQSTFDMIRDIWIYKMVVLMFPLIAFIIIANFIYQCILAYNDVFRNNKPLWQNIILLISMFLVTVVVSICGVIASVLALEIANFVWPCLILFLLGTGRIPSKRLDSQFWLTILNWVKSSKSSSNKCNLMCFNENANLLQTSSSSSLSGYKYIHSKKQEIIMKICCVNWAVSNTVSYKTDEVMVEFLRKQCEESQYMNIGFSDLRTNTNDTKQSTFIGAFLNWYAQLFYETKSDYLDCKRRGVGGDELTVLFIQMVLFGIITWILGPLYLISRIVTLLFPITIVFLLYFKNGINIFDFNNKIGNNGIDSFQIVMIYIYISLSLILLILFAFNIYEQFLMFHFLGSRETLVNIETERDHKQYQKAIMNNYYSVIVIPIREYMINDKFGNDLGTTILSFLPKNDHFDVQDLDAIMPLTNTI